MEASRGPRKIPSPFSLSGSSLTYCDAPISVVAEWTGLSWDQVDGIQSRAVARGLARKKFQDIGVDETSARKGLQLSDDRSRQRPPGM